MLYHLRAYCCRTIFFFSLLSSKFQCRIESDDEEGEDEPYTIAHFFPFNLPITILWRKKFNWFRHIHSFIFAYCQNFTHWQSMVFIPLFLKKRKRNINLDDNVTKMRRLEASCNRNSNIGFSYLSKLCIINSRTIIELLVIIAILRNVHVSCNITHPTNTFALRYRDYLLHYSIKWRT